MVALSTVEAEYIAMSEAVKESIRLQGLMQEIRKSGITGDISGEQSGEQSREQSGEGAYMAQILYTDSQGAISLAKNPQHHWRSKHIDIRYHFIRHQIKDRLTFSTFLPHR